jgi:hypothetical protein
MTNVQRIRVVLNGNKRNVPLFLVLAQYILASMTNNSALFVASAALLATLTTQIAALIAEQGQVKSRIVGAKGARDAKRNLIALTLESLRVQVQTLCDATPTQAMAIIQAAGMKAANVGRHAKAVLAATLGAQPGVVSLVANAALLSASTKSKSYNWMYSLDGKTWIAAPSTPHANTTITGLTSLASYSFRVNVSVGSAGPGEWSQAVTIVVH